MPGRFVQWNRTTCGSTSSKCGRFKIKPASYGRGFELKKFGKVAGRSFSEDYGTFPTIKKAKDEADHVARTDEARRVDQRVSEMAAKRRALHVAPGDVIEIAAVCYRIRLNSESRAELEVLPGGVEG